METNQHTNAMETTNIPNSEIPTFKKFVWAFAMLMSIFMVGFAASTGGKFTFKGKVSYILDADLIVLTDEKDIDVLIRLKGIDCPDSGQAFYNNAKDMVESYLKNQVVTVNCDSSDLYGRTFGEVVLADGRNLSKELLRFGYAWHYTRYSNDTSYASLEKGARAAQLGIWKYNDPVPPWVFRRDDTVKVDQYYGTFLEMPTDLPKESKTVASGAAKDIGASSGSGKTIAPLRPRIYLSMEKKSGPDVSPKSQYLPVYICNSRSSHVYHRVKHCTGVADCQNRLEEVTHLDAVNKYHRNGCNKCW